MDDKPLDDAAPDAPPPAAAPGGAASSTSHPPHPPLSPEFRRRAAWAAAGVFVLALVFGGWGLWRVIAPASGDLKGQLASSEASVQRLREQNDALAQRVATLSRSDQISRDANRDVQRTLAERDEEIAGLRADVAFYERLVGATAQRRGLSVHGIRFQPQGDTAWHFTTTLTQNLNRGSVSSGGLQLQIEGTRAGKREVLAWSMLRQDPSAAGLPYSFKYFQQVEGDVFLPEGFEPVRVQVQLRPRNGAAVEQSFTWADSTRDSPLNGADADAPPKAGG
ncbi:DUF6776 family protein [Marilutibacter aestuarii]|uniref:DUF6776 family protein n=1 Tax=Marilutibacter aestuarii TaxID=1706195 RepID=UPI001FECFB94|nr:DUF6776 family protein [Lysobacter aestuarii]